MFTVFLFNPPPQKNCKFLFCLGFFFLEQHRPPRYSTVLMGQCTGVTNINLLWKNKNAPNYFHTLEGASSFISLLPWSLNLLQSLREKWIQNWITKVLEENVRAAARLVNATRQRWTLAHKPRKKKTWLNLKGGVVWGRIPRNVDELKQF